MVHWAKYSTLASRPKASAVGGPNITAWDRRSPRVHRSRSGQLIAQNESCEHWSNGPSSDITHPGMIPQSQARGHCGCGNSGAQSRMLPCYWRSPGGCGRYGHRLSNGQPVTLEVHPRWLGKDFKPVQQGTRRGHGHHASPTTHWRRGHWRNQPHGPGRQMQRLVWIRPCMINAN